MNHMDQSFEGIFKIMDLMVDHTQILTVSFGKLYSYFMETNLIGRHVCTLQIGLSVGRVMYNLPHIRRSIHVRLTCFFKRNIRVRFSGYNQMLYVYKYNNTKLFYQLSMLLRLIVPPFTECSSFSEIVPGEKEFVLLQVPAKIPCFMWLLYLGILKLLRF